MNFELRSIAAKGDLQNERVTLRANADLDVGDYLLMQCGYRQGSVTTDVFHTFWFPYKAVAKGDLVVLYTRKGTESSKPLKAKGLAHFFYWGLSASIWAAEAKAAVLLQAPTWDSKPARDLWRR